MLPLLRRLLEVVHAQHHELAKDDVGDLAALHVEVMRPRRPVDVVAKLVAVAFPHFTQVHHCWHQVERVVCGHLALDLARRPSRHGVSFVQGFVIGSRGGGLQIVLERVVYNLLGVPTVQISNDGGLREDRVVPPPPEHPVAGVAVERNLSGKIIATMTLRIDVRKPSHHGSVVVGGGLGPVGPQFVGVDCHFEVGA